MEPREIASLERITPERRQQICDWYNALPDEQRSLVDDLIENSYEQSYWANAMNPW